MRRAGCRDCQLNTAGPDDHQQTPGLLLGDAMFAALPEPNDADFANDGDLDGGHRDGDGDGHDAERGGLAAHFVLDRTVAGTLALLPKFPQKFAAI